MKNNSNNKLSKSNNSFNPNSNNNNNILKKSYKDFGSTLSNLSSSIDTRFNTINNIRDSKIVKIKNIIKKNPKQNNQNIKQQNLNLNIKKKEKEKEKELSDDDSSDYANPDDDDFNNILRESISIKTLNESKMRENPFNTIDNQKIKNKNIIIIINTKMNK